MKARVEDAGPPLRAAAVRSWARFTGQATRRVRVGPAMVEWAYRWPAAVAVSHPTSVGLLAALAGVAGAPQEYELALLWAGVPTGGARAG